MRRSLLSLTAILFLFSCKEPAKKEHGPIVMGDSSMIVTETDQQFLTDIVPDLQGKDSASKTDPAAAPVADTSNSHQPATPAAQAPAGNGLTMTFKEVTVFIPGISTNPKSKDLTKANSAAFSLADGNLAGNTLQFSSGQVTKVSQRVQTGVVLKQGNESLALSSLAGSTSGWTVLKGNSNNYMITGLDSRSLQLPNIAASAYQSAIQKAGKANRLSQKQTQDWINSMRNGRAANHAQPTPVLKSVTWKVEGKGFTKEIRIDIP